MMESIGDPCGSEKDGDPNEAGGGRFIVRRDFYKNHTSSRPRCRRRARCLSPSDEMEDQVHEKADDAHGDGRESDHSVNRILHGGGVEERLMPGGEGFDHPPVKIWTSALLESPHSLFICSSQSSRSGLCGQRFRRQHVEYCAFVKKASLFRSSCRVCMPPERCGPGWGRPTRGPAWDGERWEG